MSWPRYEPATYNSGGASPGAQALMNVMVEDYGARNLGIYNWRTVRGPSQTISLHGEGRAPDLGYTNKAKGDAALALLLRHRMALGLQMAIWWRRIYSAKAPNGAAYQGVSPHTDHIHAELTRHASRTLTESYIRALFRSGGVPVYVPPAVVKPTTPIVAKPAAPPLSEEDDMEIIAEHPDYGTRFITISNGVMHDTALPKSDGLRDVVPVRRIDPDALQRLRKNYGAKIG